MSHGWSLCLRMLEKGLLLKTTTWLVFFLWLVKVFETLEECDLFSDFHYEFRSSRSTADLPTVVSDRIARAFNKPGVTRAVALGISKALTEFGMLVFFTNLSLMEFQVRYLA